MVRAGVLAVGILFVSISHSLAQPTATSLQRSQFRSDRQAIELTPPLPAVESPEEGNGYSAQFAGEWPPLPANVLSLPYWSLGDGFYIVDDRDVDYDELKFEAEALELIAMQLDKRFSKKANNVMNVRVSYGNPVYLTNTIAVSGGSATTAAGQGGAFAMVHMAIIGAGTG